MTETPQQLSKTDAIPLIQSLSINHLSGDQLVKLFKEEKGIQKALPENYWHSDPRSQEPILYNPARAARPNADSKVKTDQSSCPICQGKTTKIIDYADLSIGFTFTNKNLFPAIYPHKKQRRNSTKSTSSSAWGMHFLQWTSSFHDRDWHNMDTADLGIVMTRLGALEHHLLTSFPDIPEESRHVSIVKNGGLGSGGSMAHGHQQIIFSSFLPRRAIENQAFEKKHGQVFSKFILEENPKSLVIQDFGEAVLLVPYFMRRPYDMLLILKDTNKKHIYQLSSVELLAVSVGWKSAISAIHGIMAHRNQSISYNVITHNGPGAGLYFEFLPRTQTEGGFELIGISVCQSSAEIAASHIREVLQQT
jgi:galactose-1-phosphate uridylyltransferase